MWERSRFVLAAAALSSLVAWQPAGAGDRPAVLIAAAPSGMEYQIVDCLLAGQVRRVGSKMTYLSPRRALKTTAGDCETRGGEYVAFDRADYRTALMVWQQEADGGGAEAQYQVAEIYERGLGTQPNYALAASWYRKSADQGFSKAAVNLGRLYEQGLLGAADLNQAGQWYQKALGLPGDAFERLQKPEMERLQARIASQEQEIGQLRGELDRLNKELDGARGDLRRRSDEMTRERRRLEAARREVEQRKLQLAALADGDARAELEARLKAREGDLSRQKSEVEQLRSDVAKLKSESDRQAKLAEDASRQAKGQGDSAEEVERQKQAMRRLEAALAERTQSFEQAREELTQKEQQAANHRQRLEQLQRDLGAQGSASQARLEEERAQRQALERQLAERAATLGAQSGEVGTLRAEIARLAADSGEMQKRFQRDLQQAVGQASGAQAGVIERLRAEIAKADEDSRQRTAALEEARRVLADKDETALQYRKRVAELEQKMAQPRADQTQMARDRDELATQVRKLKEREDELAVRNEDIQRLRDSVRQASGSAASRQAELVRELDRVQGVSRTQAEELEQQRLQLATNDARLRERVTALDTARRQVAERDTQVQELNKRMAALQETVAQKSVGDDTLKTYKAQLAEAESNLKARTAETEKRDRELAALNSKVQKLEAAQSAQSQKVQGAQQSAGISLGSAPASGQEGQGPVIELIDPPIVATRARVQFRMALGAERTVAAKVTSTGGLKSVTMNDRRVEMDKDGLYRTEVPRMRSAADKVNIRIAAEDMAGRKSEFSISLLADERPASPGTGRPEAALTTISEPPAAKVDPAIFGRYFGLLIGNDNYAHWTPLKNAAADARSVSEVLTKRYGFRTTVLINATRSDILRALNQFRQSLTEKDNFLLYYAGHGHLDTTLNRGYWIPVNAATDETTEWLQTFEINDQLKLMSAKQVLVISDSCYAGTLSRASLAKLQPGLSSEGRMDMLRTLSGKRTRTAMSSGGVKPVLDSGAGQHSVFAGALLEVLRENDDFLESDRLHAGLKAKVIAVAAGAGVEQIPTHEPIHMAGHEGGDFIFVSPRLIN